MGEGVAATRCMSARTTPRTTHHATHHAHHRTAPRTTLRHSPYTVPLHVLHEGGTLTLTHLFCGALHVLHEGIVDHGDE